MRLIAILLLLSSLGHAERPYLLTEIVERPAAIQWGPATSGLQLGYWRDKRYQHILYFVVKNVYKKPVEILDYFGNWEVTQIHAQIQGKDHKCKIRCIGYVIGAGKKVTIPPQSELLRYSQKYVPPDQREGRLLKVLSKPDRELYTFMLNTDNYIIPKSAESITISYCDLHTKKILLKVMTDKRIARE